MPDWTDERDAAITHVLHPVYVGLTFCDKSRSSARDLVGVGGAEGSDCRFCRERAKKWLDRL